MEEKIIRPTTKPEAIKGKLLKYQGTDYCEFLPEWGAAPDRVLLQPAAGRKFALHRLIVQHFFED